MLTIHDQAPDFELLNQNGSTVKLSDYLGQRVVLYFYPMDFTPSCTAQACQYRDANDEFEKLNVKVFGISKDSVEKHLKFKEKHSLNFELLSDSDGKVAKQYGVLSILKVKRTTFILDKNHVITHVFEKTDPKTDSQRVLEALEKENL